MSKNIAAIAEPAELLISVEGKIISSNFDSFRAWAEQKIKGINMNLETDEDFGQAKQDEKDLKAFEDKLTVTEDEALRSLEDVYALINGMREIKGKSSEKRLTISKMIKTRMEEVKDGLVKDGISRLKLKDSSFIRSVQDSIKNRRTLDSMKASIAEVVDELNALVDQNEETIALAESAYGASVTFGKDQLLKMHPDTLKVELERRIERLKAELEKQRQADEIARLKKEQEEQAKAQAPAPTPAPAPPAPPAPAPEPAPSSATYEPVVELVGSQGITQEQEAERFINVLRSCFAPAKEARLELRHELNIKAAQDFATGMADLWENLQTSIGIEA